MTDRPGDPDEPRRSLQNRTMDFSHLSSVVRFLMDWGFSVGVGLPVCPGAFCFSGYTQPD